MNFNTTLTKIMIHLIKEHKDTTKKSNQGRKYKESIKPIEKFKNTKTNFIFLNFFLSN